MASKIELLDEVDRPTYAEIVEWCEARGWTLVRDRGDFVVYTNGRIEIDVCRPERRHSDHWEREGHMFQTLAAASGISPASVARGMTAGRHESL